MSRLKFYYYLKQIIILFPAPIFLALSGLYFIFPMNYICGIHSHEMQLMWFLMSIAHSKPWIEMVEIKFCKNCHKH
jgi:hypothetical protein